MLIHNHLSSENLAIQLPEPYPNVANSDLEPVHWLNRRDDVLDPSPSSTQALPIEIERRQAKASGTKSGPVVKKTGCTWTSQITGTYTKPLWIAIGAVTGTLIGMIVGVCCPLNHPC